MNKKIYVGFDIDETIIHSKQINDGIPFDDADFNLYHENGSYAYSVYIRDNANLLLNYIDKNYNLFFYTRATKDYATQILINLGFENPRLFHSKYIDVETVDTVYEGIKKFKVKRLDKISNKLGCDIDDIVFFDDIKNNYEIRPTYLVVQVKPYIGYDNDVELGNIFNKICNLKNNEITAKTLRNELINEKNKLKI